MSISDDIPGVKEASAHAHIHWTTSLLIALRCAPSDEARAALQQVIDTFGTDKRVDEEYDAVVEKISGIQEARTRNNVHWMDLMRLALYVAPDGARAILKQINEEDDNISELLKSL